MHQKEKDVIKMKNNLRILMQKKNIYYVLLLMVYVIIALYYGFIPGIAAPSLGLTFNLSGVMWDCNWTTSYSTLWPYGAKFTEGFIYEYLGIIFRPFFKSPMVLYVFVCLLVYSISFISLYILLKKILKNKAIIILGIIMFYQNPLMINNMGIPQIGLSSMLFSVSLLLDYYVLTESEKKYRYYILPIIGRILLAITGSYVAVIFATTTCIFTLIYVVFEVIGNKKNGGATSIFFGKISILIHNIISWIIALGVMYILTPKGVSNYSSSLEFLNGCSVDIITLLLPTKNLMVSNLIPSWNNMLEKQHQLYGDGTMWSNYLGVVFVLLLILSILRKELNSVTKTLICVFFVGLILSMGPGVKFIEQYEYTGQLQYNLEFSSAPKFPWANLFTIFPFNMMRAVYRWLFISRIALWLITVLELDSLCRIKRKGIVISIFLGIIAIIEFYPKDGIVSRIELTCELYNQVKCVDRDLVQKLDKYLDKNDIVVVHTYGENGYLLPYAMSQLNVNCYEGAGDKAILLASDCTPEIVDSFSRASEVEDIIDGINEIDCNDMAEWIVYPYFNVRWDSYRWPHKDKKTIISEQEKAVDISQKINMDYDVFFEDYFMIIKMNQKSK